MKIAQKAIITLIISSLLLTLFSPTMAIEENKTIIDDVDDIIDDFSGEIVTENEYIDLENIDIKELTYSRINESVTLSLEVHGEIENRGNIDDLTQESLDLQNLDIAGYAIILETSNGLYNIYYVNNEVNSTYYDNDDNLTYVDTSYSLDGETLTIEFNLQVADDTYSTLYASSTYTRLDISQFSEEDLEGFFILTDVAADTPLAISINDVYEEEVQEDIKFYAAVLGGSPPYNYQWDFGDGETSNEKTPTHAYTKSDNYTVSLTVTDSSDPQEEDSSSIVITIYSTDENGGSTDSNLIMFGLVLLILIIIGVIAVVIIIRR